MRLVVGIADVVPKLIVKKLLDPARTAQRHVRMVCREGKTERLLTELASHNLDVVITDSPLPSGSSVRAFNHLLGECGMTVFGRRDLAARYRKRFPQSLNGAPMLLPSEATTQRHALDLWFDANGVRPMIEAEFDDSALLNEFGQDGAGLFAAPTAIEDFIKKQYEVSVVGRLPEVRERFYAISIERRIRHPAVVAIYEGARAELFKKTSRPARASSTS